MAEVRMLVNATPRARFRLVLVSRLSEMTSWSHYRPFRL